MKFLAVFGLVVGGLAWALLVFLLGIMTDFAFSTAGWALLGLGIWSIPALILAGQLRGRIRVAVIAGLLAICLAGSAAWWVDAPPSHGRIRAVADRTQLPPDWGLEKSEESGNTWGLFSDYPRITRTYAADPAAIPAAVELLEQQGWEQSGSWRDGHSVRLTRGRWVMGLNGPSIPSDSPGVQVTWSRS